MDIIRDLPKDSVPSASNGFIHLTSKFASEVLIDTADIVVILVNNAPYRFKMFFFKELDGEPRIVKWKDFTDPERLIIRAVIVNEEYGKAGMYGEHYLGGYKDHRYYAIEKTIGIDMQEIDKYVVDEYRYHLRVHMGNPQQVVAEQSG